MFRKYLKTFIYAAVLLIPVAIVFLRPKTLNALAILDASAAHVGWVKGIVFEFKKIFYYRETYDEYLKLKKQTDILKARNIKLQEALGESKRFEQLSDYKHAQSFKSVIAFVIGRDPSNWNASLVINKGKVDGITVGMSVLSTLGVVGKIIEVGHRTSKVVSVSNPDFSVAALVARTRESGLLSGTLEGICRLHYLTDNADVKVGDNVLTSKLSSAFPEGVLIGRVVDIQASMNSHTVECLVEPVVDLSQIEEVIIVKN